MKGSRVGAIAIRIVKQFRHDRRSVALIVIVPLVVMALIGYLIGDAGKEPLPVAVVNLDMPTQTPAGPVSVGGRIADLLRQDPTIEVRDVGSVRAAQALVRDGEITGAIVLPQGLTQEVLGGGTAQVDVVVIGTESSTQGPVIEAARGALASLPKTAGGITGFPSAPLSLRLAPLEGGLGLTTLDYGAPALIAVFAFFFTFLLTSVSFLRERSSGTLERLMASPVTRLEVLLGYLLGFIGFALAQSLVVLGYAIVVLDVPNNGSIWLVLLVIVILVVGSVNLGIALSFYARNELQVVQFIPLVILPQVFLGGLFWPVQTLWPPLRLLAQLFPLTHAVAALRAVMIGGEDLSQIAGRVLALLALSAAMVVLGVTALRKQRV